MIKRFKNATGEAVGFNSKADWFMRRDAFVNYVGCLENNCEEWSILNQLLNRTEEWVVLNYSDPTGLKYQFLDIDC